MASTRLPLRRPRLRFVQKSRGRFHRRSQQVGPEHFGIVSVDCAKVCSQ
jgi:hypothetical protein